jgi:hypothetical protein
MSDARLLRPARACSVISRAQEGRHSMQGILLRLVAMRGVCLHRLRSITEFSVPGAFFVPTTGTRTPRRTIRSRAITVASALDLRPVAGAKVHHPSPRRRWNPSGTRGLLDLGRVADAEHRARPCRRGEAAASEPYAGRWATVARGADHRRHDQRPCCSVRTRDGWVSLLRLLVQASLQARRRTAASAGRILK